MPDEVKKEALKELGRLSRMSPMAADYSLTRNYIEWLAVLPWAKTSGAEVDIPKAKEVLDTDHYDLEKVKDRILDYLSVAPFETNMKGPILCFVGPPASAKLRSASRSRERSDGSSSVCRSVVCMTRQKSVAIAVLISALCRGKLFRAFAVRRPKIQFLCSTKSTKSGETFAATRLLLCWRPLIPSRTPASATTTWT